MNKRIYISIVLLSWILFLLNSCADEMGIDPNARLSEADPVDNIQKPFEIDSSEFVFWEFIDDQQIKWSENYEIRVKSIQVDTTFSIPTLWMELYIESIVDSNKISIRNERVVSFETKISNIRVEKFHFLTGGIYSGKWFTIKVFSNIQQKDYIFSGDDIDSKIHFYDYDREKGYIEGEIWATFKWSTTFDTEHFLCEFKLYLNTDNDL